MCNLMNLDVSVGGLQVKDHLVVAVTDSPKPPPRRVTLTLPAVNAARQIVFVSTGESKSAILKVLA